MAVLCPAPAALIALQTASLQPFLPIILEFPRWVEILRYPRQSLIARTAPVNDAKEQQDENVESHVGWHGSAGLQDVILVLRARRNAP